MAGETFGAELSSLNFRDIIGGPLCAVVEAQTQAAMATIGFIESIGFERDPKDKTKMLGTRNATFNYKTWIPPSNNNDGAGQEREVQLVVPLLTLVNPPSLRIEKVIIDFNVKLTSVERKQVTENIGVGVDLDAKGGFGPFSAELKASFSYQKKTEEGTEVNRSYTLGVHVEAVQDELPAGLDRVLTLLENSIRPVASPTTTPAKRLSDGGDPDPVPAPSPKPPKPPAV